MRPTLVELAQRATAVGDALLESDDALGATALVAADVLSCVYLGRTHPTVRRLLASQEHLGNSGAWEPLASPTTPRGRVDALTVDVTAAHIDEMDPVHPLSGTVPGAVVVPAAFHAGAAAGASGIRFLGAVAAGYEVTAAASLMLGGSSLYRKAWWPAAVAGRLGSAMAVAYTLGLGIDQTVNALALATASAGGLLSADIFADSHYVLLGDAASAGAQAAYRAASGLRGSPTLLDKPARRAFDGEPVPTSSDLPHVLKGMHKEFPCATPLQGVIHGLLAMGGPAAVNSAVSIDVKLPAPTLAFVSCDQVVDGPPEAAASLAHAIGAVARDRAHDVEFFRAADSALSYRHRLTLSPSKDASIELSLTFPEGERRVVQPLHDPECPEALIARRNRALFGNGNRWSSLAGLLVTGADLAVLRAVLAF